MKKIIYILVLALLFSCQNPQFKGFKYSLKSNRLPKQSRYINDKGEFLCRAEISEGHITYSTGQYDLEKLKKHFNYAFRRGLKKLSYKKDHSYKTLDKDVELLFITDDGEYKITGSEKGIYNKKFSEIYRRFEILSDVSIDEYYSIIDISKKYRSACDYMKVYWGDNYYVVIEFYNDSDEMLKRIDTDIKYYDFNLFVLRLSLVRKLTVLVLYIMYHTMIWQNQKNTIIQ